MPGYKRPGKRGGFGLWDNGGMAGLRSPHGNKPHTSVEVIADELTDITPQAEGGYKVMGINGGKVPAVAHGKDPKYVTTQFLPGNEMSKVGGAAAAEKMRKAKRDKELIKAGKKAPPGVKSQVFFKHPEASEDYQYFTHLAKRYYKHRIIELSQINQGPVSAAVCNILQSAAWCLLASRWMNYEASKPENAKNMLDLMTKASSMGEKSRQHELAAWELNAREVKSRPKKVDPTAYMQGFFENDDGTVGEVKANQGWSNGPAITEKAGAVTAYGPAAGLLNRAGQEIRRGRGRPKKITGQPWDNAMEATNSGVKPKCGQSKQNKEPPTILELEEMPDNPLGVDIDDTLARGYDPGKKDIT